MPWETAFGTQWIQGWPGCRAGLDVVTERQSLALLAIKSGHPLYGLSQLTTLHYPSYPAFKFYKVVRSLPLSIRSS